MVTYEVLLDMLLQKKVKYCQKTCNMNSRSYGKYNKLYEAEISNDFFRKVSFL